MTDRIPVVFLINSLAGGGAEKAMLNLLDGLADDARFDCTLVLLDREPFRYDVPDKIKIVELDSRNSLLSSVRHLYRHLRRARPRVVVSYLARSNYANILCGRLLGHRSIVSERINPLSHFGSGLKGKVSLWLIDRLYPRADAVVAVSAGVRDYLVEHGVAPARVSVIQNVIDLDKIRDGGRDGPALPAPYIVAVGRLVPNKNYPALLTGYARSQVQAPLYILGEGPEREALLNLARDLNIAERVHFLGFVPRPYGIVSGAALFVSMSNSEGFPNSMVESLALGVPVVVTDCPSGPREVLAGLAGEVARLPYRTDYGTLIPVNSPDHLADALRDRLFGTQPQPQFDPADIVGAYSREAITRRYADLILSVL